MHVQMHKIKVEISQNKVRISQNYSQCLSPVHVFFSPSCHFGGSVDQNPYKYKKKTPLFL